MESLTSERQCIMTLEEFAHYYFDNHPTGIRKSTQDCYYLPAARIFDRSMKVPVEKFDKLTANRFVDWLKSQPTSPKTQHGRRRAFGTLWTAAHDAGLAPDPVPFRRIVVPKKSPVAWDFESVQRLVKAVQSDRSLWCNGIEFGAYWGSLFSAAWDSALRLGDLLDVEYSWIIRDKNGCGLLRKVQSKTLKEHYVQLHPSTMQAITVAMTQCPSRRLIWPLKTTRRRFYEHMQKILKEHGFTGSFRYFRRSAITFAESQNPGAGQRMAGHQDSRTTRESYIDPMLLPKSVVVVKPLS